MACSSTARTSGMTARGNGMLRCAVSEKGILLLDGGMGTGLVAKGLTNEESWISAYLLNDAKIRQAVRQVHEDFVAAGCDVLSTNTYHLSNAYLQRPKNRELMDRVVEDSAPPEGFEELDRQCMKESVDLAREVLRNAVKGNSVLVALTLGPFGNVILGHPGTANRKLRADEIRVPGYGVAFDQLVRFWKARIASAISCQPDVIAVETIPDLIEARAIGEALQACSRDGVPDIWVSFTCANGEKTDHGQPFADCVAALCAVPAVTAVGMNCTAPHFVKSLCQIAKRAIAEISAAEEEKTLLVVYPNSGEVYAPENPDGSEWEAADSVPFAFGEFVKDLMLTEGGIAAIGGCCRITAADLTCARAVLT